MRLPVSRRLHVVLLAVLCTAGIPAMVEAALDERRPGPSVDALAEQLPPAPIDWDAVYVTRSSERRPLASLVKTPVGEAALSPFVTPAPLIQWDAIAQGGSPRRPPGTSVAAGTGTGVNGRVVEVTNAWVQIYDKTGATRAGPTGLDVMFPPAPGSFVLEPKILFDQDSGRFFIVVLELDYSGAVCTSTLLSSRIRIAVSTSAVPTNLTTDWTFLAQAAPPLIMVGGVSTWSDSPAIGADSDSVFVTTNQLSAPCTYQGSNVRVFDKAALIAGAYSAMDVTFAGHPPIQPAHVFGATDDGGFYLIARVNDAAYRLYHITGDPLAPGAVTVDAPWTAGTDPVDDTADQCVLSPDVEALAVDAPKVMSAVYRNGSVWAVQTSDFDLDPQTEAVWHQIQTNAMAPAVVQFGSVPETGVDPWTYNPSINVDPAGNALVNYSQSSGGECPSMYAAVHLLTDGAGAMQPPVVVKASGFYDSLTAGGTEPWGRYSAVAIDPADQCFWMVNEFASTSVVGGSLWGTHVAKICLSLEGACCFGEKACSMREEGACTALGGNFRGIGSKCPTQNVFSAMHSSGPVVHWVDPAVNCSDIEPLLTSSNCCVARPVPGCDTPSCESQVCASNSFCCDFEWDPTCVQLAQSVCGSLCAQGCDPGFAIDPWVTPPPGVASAAPISIPDSGTGSPYPSSVTVSGLVGAVTSVSLTLTNIHHTYPDDIDILLVGPGGQNLVVMSDAGGDTDAVGVTLTLSDSAPSFLSDTGPLVSGAFRPANYPPSETFPAPAPAPSGASSFSIFNGTNPNGIWRLYVFDAFTNDSGSIENWSLNVTTSGGGAAGHSTCDSSFNLMPIPAGFFDPNSQPFSGTICYQGRPLGSPYDPADTLVRRYGEPFSQCQAPSANPSTVPIEIVALDLVSVQPIQVQSFSQTTYWNVEVDLSVVPAPTGSMTATKTHCNGGTWSSTLPVQPRFTFTRIDDPGQVRVFDTGAQGYPPIVLNLDNSYHPWVSDLDPNLHVPGSECTNFHPGIDASSATTSCDCNSNGQIDLCDIAGGTSADCNRNGVPDECDPDSDGDGVGDGCDSCPTIPNPGQQNADGDRYGDACDLCPVLPERLDGDHDGDRELEVPELVLPPGDNCPCIPNPDQIDTDGDGIGNACECVNVTCAAPDQCHLAGTCDPTTGACSNPVKPDGSACNDANSCTSGDACQAGVCRGTPQPLEEVATVSVGGPSKDTISWSPLPRATVYDLVRGNLSGLPVGPGGGDEICLGNDLATTTRTDSSVPPSGTGYWYLARAENNSCVGSYGTEGQHGIPVLSRYTSTCPAKCLGHFFQVATGDFTSASSASHPCIPPPCGGAPCIVAAHLATDAKANAACSASGPKPSGDPCVLTVDVRDANPIVVCTEIPSVSYTCTCIIGDSYDCDP